MSDLIGKLALTICIGSILAILIYLMKYLLKLFKSINQKTPSLQEDNIYRYLDNTIQTGAISISKKVAESRENADNLSQSDKEEEQVNIYENIRKVIRAEKLKELGNYIGNIDEWILNRIEFYIHNNKSD